MRLTAAQTAGHCQINTPRLEDWLWIDVRTSVLGVRGEGGVGEESKPGGGVRKVGL